MNLSVFPTSKLMFLSSEKMSFFVSLASDPWRHLNREYCEWSFNIWLGLLLVRGITYFWDSVYNRDKRNTVLPMRVIRVRLSGTCEASSPRLLGNGYTSELVWYLCNAISSTSIFPRLICHGDACCSAKPLRFSHFNCLKVHLFHEVFLN